MQCVRGSVTMRPSVSLGKPSRCLSVKVRAEQALGVQVRPYTLRSGDTLENIAKKRSITVSQLTELNPDKKVEAMVPGTTILLPSNKLSARDLEILSGIGASYRVYPVRAGETLQDILSKRGITDEEFQRLNPGIKIDSLKSDAAVLRLPVGKFTMREREMLIGSGVLPKEFFITADNPFVIGAGLLMGVCGFVLAWQRFYKDEDEEYVEEVSDLNAPPSIIIRN